MFEDPFFWAAISLFFAGMSLGMNLGEYLNKKKQG